MVIFTTADEDGKESLLKHDKEHQSVIIAKETGRSSFFAGQIHKERATALTETYVWTHSEELLGVEVRAVGYFKVDSKRPKLEGQEIVEGILEMEEEAIEDSSSGSDDDLVPPDSGPVHIGRVGADLVLVDVDTTLGWETKTEKKKDCLLYTSPSPRDATLSRMPSSA